MRGRGGGRPALSHSSGTTCRPSLCPPPAMRSAEQHRTGRDRTTFSHRAAAVAAPPPGEGGGGSSGQRGAPRGHRLPPWALLACPLPGASEAKAAGPRRAEASSRLSRRARRLDQRQGHAGVRVFIGLRCPVNWIETKRGERGSVILENRRGAALCSTVKLSYI